MSLRWLVGHVKFYATSETIWSLSIWMMGNKREGKIYPRNCCNTEKTKEQIHYELYNKPRKCSINRLESIGLAHGLRRSTGSRSFRVSFSVPTWGICNAGYFFTRTKHCTPGFQYQYWCWKSKMNSLKTFLPDAITCTGNRLLTGNRDEK